MGEVRVAFAPASFFGLEVPERQLLVFLVNLACEAKVVGMAVRAILKQFDRQGVPCSRALTLLSAPTNAASEVEDISSEARIDAENVVVKPDVHSLRARVNGAHHGHLRRPSSRSS